MRYMKMIGPYTDYGRPDMWDNESEVKCYTDTGIRQVEEYNKNNVALLIEPRSIQPDVYELVEKNSKYFTYIFTHDSKLLELPNARPIIWGGCWCRIEHPRKDKLVGMLCSHKTLTELHRIRFNTAYKFKDRDNFDLYGPFKDNKRIDPLIAHERYMYEVVVENYIDNLWFTEKIIDCFATKTIPIYLGATDIGKYFNIDGIIVVHNEEELNNKIEEIIQNKEYYEQYYNIKLNAINENYELSNKYNNFEELFYSTYEKEIQELFI